MQVFKKRIALWLVVLLVAFQWLSLGSHQVHAATINQGIMVSAPDLNSDGEPAIAMTAVAIQQGETALDILKKVAKNLKVTDDPTYGAYINAINGVEPSGDAYWGFFINGVEATVGISSYEVEPGDDLLFKLVTYPPKTVRTHVSLEDPNGQPLHDKDGHDILNKDVTVVNGANAYDVFKAALGDKLKTSLDSHWFAFVDQIEDIELQEGSYWSFNINQSVAQVGLASYIVKDGDTLSLSGAVAGVGENQNDENTNNDETDDAATHDQADQNENKDANAGVQISSDEWQASISQAIRYLKTNHINDFYSALAFRLHGEQVPQDYIDSLGEEVKGSNGVFRNVTDYEKRVLTISAAGGDATHFVGYNLVKGIYNNERMVNQGNNGPVYGLLALDSGHYKVPEDAIWTRQKLVDYILKEQNKDGGWALTGTESSADLTGMALAALAPYKDQSHVKAAIDQAVEWLSSVQNKKGGYDSDANGGDSSESIAQAIIGLTAVGIDPTSAAFTKAKGNLLSHLLEFQQKDGGFAHLIDEPTNAFSTPQALLALTSYETFVKQQATPLQFNNDGKELKVNVEEATQETHDSQTGDRLPDTATDTYNYYLLGFILLMMGALLFVYNRKKKRA